MRARGAAVAPTNPAVYLQFDSFKLESLEMLRGGGSRGGAEFVALFRWIFIAGALFLAAGLIAVLVIEERPLRGPGSDARRPVAQASEVKS